MNKKETMIKNPFLDLVEQRQSVRKFEGRPVEREKILTCIEAAHLAPSAENVQPWRFIVIDDRDVKQRFCKGVFSGIYTPTRFAAKAPVIIAVLAKKDLLANTLGKQIQGTSWYLIDIGRGTDFFVYRSDRMIKRI